MTVTLQNAAGPAATNLSTTLNFPNGITYLPGTVVGATESNISNLGAPVFSLANLAGGASVSFTLNVAADCPLVGAINSGQTFSNGIVVNYMGGNNQITSSLFPVETGLLNISTVTPPAASGQKGDVIMRTITMKNTRQGPIKALKFRDTHFPGISIELIGGINQSNTPTQFTADIPGSYFTNFGNGNDLLEFDEEITLVEKVTIEDCGIPSFTNQSLIVIGWGCDGVTNCRQDSVYAAITILPTTLNPNLIFQPVYAPPVSQCGALPSVQELLIINNGQLPATNVSITPYTIDTSFHAIDQGSFEWNNGSGWQPLSSHSGVPGSLASCQNNSYSLSTGVTVPEVQAGDTVRLRFNTYYCQPICGGLIPSMRFWYLYEKACPPNVPVSGLLNFFPDTNFLKLEASVDFELENCLQDGETYSLNYWVKSGRLLQDTGYLQVIFEIPLGFEWLNDCPFILDGQTPLESNITNNGDGSSTVRMVFDLPFTQDSVSSEICLRYVCQENMPCQAPIPNVPPRGMDYTVYPPPSDCGGCQLLLQAFTLVSVTPDEGIDCAITKCDEFILVVDDACDPGGGGGGGGGGLANLVILEFDSYRTNYGLQDNDDDRMADNNNVANAPGVRRDRYLVGDTMRTELRAYMAQGSLSNLSFRVFLESLLTDFGEADGDAYDLPASKMLFVNYDTISFISAQVTIKTATGETYTCPVQAPVIRSDQHLIQIAEPNIRPPQIVDVVGNMFHQFDLNFAGLPCLPPNFALTPGDSLIFTSDFKFKSNFTPTGANTPPLINFRNSICDIDKTYSWKLENICTEKELGQFSGFIELIDPPVQRIEPCDNSTEVSPFLYLMRIARPNMFPFEVRQLSTVTHYSYSLPTSVNLLETRLNYLFLQETVPLFGVTPLTPGFAGDSLTLDLSPFFANPLDEGYSFEISTRFDTTCGYNGTQFGRTVLGMRYANECFHRPVDTRYYIVNPNGYQDGSPNLDFFTSNNILFLPTDEVEFTFTLRNNSPITAANAWLTIETNGNLADLELVYMPGQFPVPQIGGVYQLGDMASFAQPTFRVRATSQSCRAFKITIRYGWNCSQVLNVGAVSCGSFSKIIDIRPQSPELELVIVNQPPTIPMCGPSGIFEFEISNANDGTAYNLVPSIKLPPGIRIQPGSSQLSYPLGLPFVNMPDPVQLPGNVWQFDPQAASNLLAQNGLITADQSPLNTLRIRFRVIAECGAVLNAQPIYGAESVQACGIFSNVLRRPGPPINIDGIEPSTASVPNLQVSNPPGAVGCNQELQLSASIAVSNVPMTGDSIFILLPTGTSYVPGSYQAGVNAPGGPPQVFGQQIQLPMPTNIGAGSILSFTFRIRYDDPAGCADRVVIMQTREKTQVFCSTTNQFCNISIATGEAFLILNAQNPELQVNNFELNTQGTQTTFTATLENAGGTTATNPIVQIYHDQNGNGQIDPTDPLVTTVNYTGTLAPGGAVLLSGNLNNLPPSAFCNLIARVPAEENCACVDFVFPLSGDQNITTGIGLCEVQTVDVGVQTVSGSTYTWLTPNGLSCTNCSNATYTPGPEVQPGDLVTLILQEQTGGCTIERRFEVRFGGFFGIESTDQTICQGYSATLKATAGGIAYNWSGAGISNPNQQTQIVQPAGNSVYSVTVTFDGGCTGTGTVSVFVNPSIQIELPPLSTCEGDPIAILGQTTDVPGIYTLTLQSVNGCDSIITQELRVEPINVSETRVFCAGDSVTVFDSTFTTAGVICRTAPGASGCLVTTCVTVNEVANPQVPAQDSALVIALGGSVVLEAPGGYASYEWIPDGSLSCGNCPNPVATPDTSTLYRLIVTDGNGCHDTVEYRVFICDESQIHIPTGFTPNGDGSNDFFRVVPHEGAEIILLLRVYDRWGQKLYEGSGNNAQWDGRIGNSPAPSDVYVWILDYICGGERVRKSGDVTLLR